MRRNRYEQITKHGFRPTGFVNDYWRVARGRKAPALLLLAADENLDNDILHVRYFPL